MNVFERFFHFMAIAFALAMAFTVFAIYFFVAPTISLTSIAAFIGVAAALLLVISPALKKHWSDRPDSPREAMLRRMAAKEEPTESEEPTGEFTDEQMIQIPLVRAPSVIFASGASDCTDVSKMAAPAANPPVASG
jgi:hypothetical protein